MKKQKPVHLIQLLYNTDCRAACDLWVQTQPKEYTKQIGPCLSIGTFNVKKVTCKRCLKHSLYKEALDKVNNPLFYWKERV